MTGERDHIGSSAFPYNSRLRQHLAAITSAALTAVDARRVTARLFASLAESIPAQTAVRAVAAGKAAVGMAIAAQDALSGHLVEAVVTGRPGDTLPPVWNAIDATHPRPSATSEAAGRAALVLAEHTRRDGGLLVVCLSGGASAMLVAPAPGLTLEEKSLATDTLLRAGLDISELNLLRRHLSAIKGGQLAGRAGRTMTLAISDVCTPVEDDPAIIGSGPTVGDDRTFADALAIVARHNLSRDLPRAVMAHLEAGVAGGVPGPIRADDPRLRQSAYWIAASRRDAMRGAAEAARRLGYTPHVLGPPTVAEARRAARPLIEAARGLPRPACLIASGETTVRVVGQGRGGRNQELALSALEPLGGLDVAALASLGTDGIDGPTDAAGAFVDSGMWRSLGSLGADARAICQGALDRNDSYPVLERLGALVRTGPTGTNVGDLQVVLVE